MYSLVTLTLTFYVVSFVSTLTVSLSAPRSMSTSANQSISDPSRVSGNMRGSYHNFLILDASGRYGKRVLASDSDTLQQLQQSMP